jgi:deoxyhypusine synthase
MDAPVARPTTPAAPTTAASTDRAVSRFIERHYRHFNAATLVHAADAYARHVDGGGRMLLAMAGAMSTAELGLSLAEMIRREKVHAICCTGANLEEDLFNLVAHDHYHRIEEWRNLRPEDEKDLERRGLNRITDTCIPEQEGFRRIERPLLGLWQRAHEDRQSLLPHEYVYRLIREGLIEDQYQIDPRDSWVVAAAERDLPLFVPGWEDSTLGNVYAAHMINGTLPDDRVIRSGLAYMVELADWYLRTTMSEDAATLRARAQDAPGATGGGGSSGSSSGTGTTVGFFQIGGGIAGDFPICAVPLIHQDLRWPCPYWSYFCQVSDSTTSYGSYSGALPSEKITWGKLDVDTPMYVIESDATIVVPLMFARVLGW